MFLFCSYEVNYGKRAMSHRQTQMERADEGSFLGGVEQGEVHWRELSRPPGVLSDPWLVLSKYGPAVVWQHEWY